MNATALMVLIGFVVAVVGGYFVARRSKQVEAVRGDRPAQVFHYLASAGTVGLPAAFWFALLVTIFSPQNILDDFVKYALVSLAIIVSALLLYAVVEPDPEPEHPHPLPPLD